MQAAEEHIDRAQVATSVSLPAMGNEPSRNLAMTAETALAKAICGDGRAGEMREKCRGWLGGVAGGYCCGHRRQRQTSQ